MERMLPRVNKKISGETRLLYGLAGGALVGFGLTRRSRFGGPLVLLGADLLSYAATGHHLYEALGIDLDRDGQRGRTRIPHQMGVQVQRSIRVNASPETAYEFVRELENLPRFMEHVKNVSKRDEKRSHWVVKAPAGMEVEWDAEIINDLPGELIAWRSINNPDIDSAGSIHFERAGGDNQTVVRVKMQYLPPAGILGATVAKLFGEEPEQQLQDDLGRLKTALESRAF
jgi:uncharacterized membrane protein